MQTLRIGSQDYALTHVDASRVTMERPGKLYTVERQGDGLACDCPDYRFRHADLPGSIGCKHVQAVRGMIL